MALEIVAKYSQWKHVKTAAKRACEFHQHVWIVDDPEWACGSMVVASDDFADAPPQNRGYRKGYTPAPPADPLERDYLVDAERYQKLAQSFESGRLTPDALDGIDTVEALDSFVDNLEVY